MVADETRERERTALLSERHTSPWLPLRHPGWVHMLLVSSCVPAASKILLIELLNSPMVLADTVPGGQGGGGGGEGGEGDEGGSGGGGGGAAPQLTATCAIAASPMLLAPRLYSKANDDDEKTLTLTACHVSPWSPLRLHTVSPAALVT